MLLLLLLLLGGVDMVEGAVSLLLGGLCDSVVVEQRLEAHLGGVDASFLEIATESLVLFSHEIRSDVGDQEVHHSRAEEGEAGTDVDWDSVALVGSRAADIINDGCR